MVVVIYKSNEYKVDGRVARREHTREAIIDTVIQLVDEGNFRPRATDICSRAKVSVRTVFDHFPNLELLYLAAADVHSRRILAEMPPPQGFGSCQARIEALVKVFAAFNERALRMRKITAHCEAPPEASEAQGRFAREVLHRRSEIAFNKELSLVPEDERRELLDAIQATCSIDTWALLRHNSKLAIAQAEQLCRRILHGLLRDLIAPDMQQAA